MIDLLVSKHGVIYPLFIEGEVNYKFDSLGMPKLDHSILYAIVNDVYSILMHNRSITIAAYINNLNNHYKISIYSKNSNISVVLVDDVIRISSNYEAFKDSIKLIDYNIDTLENVLSKYIA